MNRSYGGVEEDPLRGQHFGDLPLHPAGGYRMHGGCVHTARLAIDTSVGGSRIC
ncbi:MAG: hypothetical protein VCC67_13200 [Myxococcota bacterium]